MDEKRTALLRLLREARAGEGQRGDGRSDGGRLDVGWSDGGREAGVDAGARGGSRDGRPQAGAVAGIAVIGLAGRYPRAATPDELWVRTRDGEHCITEFPADRSAEGRSAEGRAGTRRWAGLIDDADAFDPLFFGIAPVDADGIDPQERVFLETVWAALEDAGHPPRRLARASNPVGVFAGVMNSDYEWMGGEATALGAANAARSSHWSIANRVSYVLDFRGPSLTVNTACSASLTAVHLACESLRSGECSVAVAGGVNLILHESHLRTLAENGMTSPGDRVRAFGKGADGFVDGEGVGAVVLKPLDRAIADGDRVYGVIRSSAVNSGGKTGGYTVPSPAAQAEVIRTSLRRAGIDPRTIGCVEAHGTGTPLGDPIEIAGLREAFAEHLDDSLAQGVERCAVGSVKSNIGHLESAAGIAGLTKMLMQLKHGTIAPSLNSGELNPDIDLAGTPFFVPQEAVAWERAEAVHTDGRRVVLPRRGAISSFGGGGANAHLIVEEYAGGEGYERGGSFQEAGAFEAAGRREGAGKAEAATSAGPHLVVLSARDDERLRVYAGRLADFLDAEAVQGDDDAEATCLRLAAEVLGVDTADLDPLTPLHEYGCGAAELTRLAEKLDAEFGQGVHLTGATTLRDLAPAPATAPTVTLADLAHTLQAGREELPARLAFPAGDLVEARALLRAYAAGEPTAEVVTGTAPAQRVAPDAGLQRALAQGDLRTVAEQWVRGAGVEWARNGGRRVSLPTYPFARKRYWLPRPAASAAAVTARTALTQKGVEPAESATTRAQSGVEQATTLAQSGVEPAPALSCYRPTWLPEPPPPPHPLPPPPPARPGLSFGSRGLPIH
ncbi:type I polyketide synthase [Streptomyces sp. V2]|uniref:beta-ketoacyl synthase N-terminal-like domain-containing protein n=1 Tax=Streptomyces sp. V2 TaxID=1424099 RepID=UPI001401F5B4|nr:type I polyketide synthase [Streptomyces sp. V2]